MNTNIQGPRGGKFNLKSESYPMQSLCVLWQVYQWSCPQRKLLDGSGNCLVHELKHTHCVTTY